MRYLVPISTSNWARYVDRIRLQVQTGVNQYRSLRVLPNRLTSIYSKNYYEEENYLKVKTVVFKYITPPHSNGCYVLTFSRILCTDLICLVHRYIQYMAYNLLYDSATPYPIALLVPLILYYVY